MKFAVFFRNLNLGRPPAPTRTQLENAFMEAGAASAASFLTNGTLVFEANAKSKATKILKGACAALQESTGFKEPAFMRNLDYLVELVRRDPFAAFDDDTAYARCVTFLDKLPADPPTANRKKNVIAVEYTPGELFSAAYKVGASPGSPNDFVEKELGAPGTTRVWNTVCRLVAKHA